MLDICVIKSVPVQIQLPTMNELSSDHNPVLVEISEPSKINPRGQKIHRQANWDAIEKEIATRETGNPTIQSCDDIDERDDESTTAIQEAVEASSKVMPPRMNIGNRTHMCCGS